jgi:hypothetical protein
MKPFAKPTAAAIASPRINAETNGMPAFVISTMDTGIRANVEPTSSWPFGQNRTMVKFQQRYQLRHASLYKPLCAKVLCVCGTPDYRPDSSSEFGSLIPTESRRLSPEICCHDITEPLATYLQEPPLSS